MKEPNQPPPHVPGKGAMYLFGDVIDKTPEPNPTPSGPVKSYARNQKCGCIVCICEDEVQCHGCGATHCGTHPIGQIPDPIYDEPDPTPPQPAPDRHEASRAAFEALHPYLSRAWNDERRTYRDTHAAALWLAWCRALDHAAQEQRRPCGECHLQPGEVCDICGKQEQPAPDGGADNKSIHTTMSNHEQSAAEWVKERIILIAVEPAYKVPRCEFIAIADALELAQRCDAAEEDAESWEAASIGLGNDLANMNDEAIRLSTKRAAAERRVERLRGALKPLVAMNDRMNDTANSDSGNYADAYYIYHKGQHNEWEAARAELIETKEGASNE